MGEKELTYDDNIKIWKDAYTEILSVCEKYPGFRSRYASEFGDIHKMEVSAKNHLLLISWYEKYGLKLNHSNDLYGSNFSRISEYTSFQYFNDAKKEKDSKKGGRYISWPDDGKQPKNEWLFCISFSTGPYIFGNAGFGDDDDCPVEFFRQFFDELKSYKPAFIDSHNNNLYFKLTNAKSIYDDFNGILKKYYALNAEDKKQRDIKKLEAQLEKMKS